MLLLKTGSTGDQVSQLQQRLTDLQFYSGPVDGTYSDDVSSAVSAFQTSRGLSVDGKVGPNTWNALFPPPPNPSLAAMPLGERCLAVTGSLETSKLVPEYFSGLAGNFDGQGISFGALQWNLGQGTLQPLLNKMLSDSPDVMANAFGDGFDSLKTMLAGQKSAQLAWAQSIQDASGKAVAEPWKSRFVALGQTAEFQAIEIAAADKYRQKGEQLFGRFGLTTERAMALMFDIAVQNGDISGDVEALIRQDYAAIPDGTDPLQAEVLKMQAVANRRAEAANPKFVEDVRTRKLMIANGVGVVHGFHYDLESQFAIRLATISA